MSGLSWLGPGHAESPRPWRTSVLTPGTGPLPAGKIFLSAGDKQLAIIAHVPKELQTTKNVTIDEWVAAVTKPLGDVTVSGARGCGAGGWLLGSRFQGMGGRTGGSWWNHRGREAAGSRGRLESVRIERTAGVRQDQRSVPPCMHAEFLAPPPAQGQSSCSSQSLIDRW